MWIPRTEEEILHAIASNLQETLTFDAKAMLPQKSKSIAEDVAAMANEGGVLLYGVADDENKQLTTATPIPIKEAGERINNIVLTSISPPPQIQIISIPTASDPSVGYLVVVVPLSPTAPHMVIVSKDHRYYGRSALGNVPLSEGEVARLYARRQVWERNVDDILSLIISQAPLEPRTDFAYLHIGAWPVGAPPDLLRRAGAETNVQTILHTLVSTAEQGSVFRDTQLVPGFYVPSLWLPQPDGWEADLFPLVPNRPDMPQTILSLWVNNDGSARIFCGRAAERNEKGLFLLEDKIAEIVTRFLWMIGQLYQQAGFVGPVDLGLAVTGIQGAVASQSQYAHTMGPSYIPFKHQEYRRTAPRVPALRVAQDARDVAQELIMPLIRTVTLDRYDPFADKRT